MKLGHIDYLNTYPLYWQMLGAFAPPAGIELVAGTPATLNRMMRCGALDVSPVSTASLPDMQGHVAVLSDFCIGSCGAVHSVLLLSKCPLQELGGHKIGVTTESETSVILLRYLLEHLHGVMPTYIKSGQVDDGAHAAILRIGNGALMADRQAYPHVYDLGKLWYEATGVPMVFAVFAAQTGTPEHARDLLGAVRRTLAQSLAGAKADREGFMKLAAAAYPSVTWNLPLYYESLKYDFTDVYKAALRTFFDLMAVAGLLPTMGEICYI